MIALRRGFVVGIDLEFGGRELLAVLGVDMPPPFKPKSPLPGNPTELVTEILERCGEMEGWAERYVDVVRACAEWRSKH